MQFALRRRSEDGLTIIEPPGIDPETAAMADTRQAADAGMAACRVIALSS